MARGLQERIAHVEEQDVDDAFAELAALRKELAATLSERFAAAYLPEGVDLAELTARVAGADIVWFHLHEFEPDRVRGHAVWMAPTSASVHEYVVTDEKLLELLGAPGRAEQRRHQMHEEQDEAQARRWAALAQHLLPPALLTHLGARRGTEHPCRLLVIPHGSLAALPWAALRLPDLRPLITVCEVQLVPSLGFLRNDAVAATSSKGPIVVHLAEPASRAESRSLRTLSVRMTASSPRLRTPRPCRRLPECSRPRAGQGRKTRGGSCTSDGVDTRPLTGSLP